jgi:hypothetical protein
MGKATIEDRLRFIERNNLPHLVTGKNTLPKGVFYMSLKNNIPEAVVEPINTPFVKEVKVQGTSSYVSKYLNRKEFEGVIKASCEEYGKSLNALVKSSLKLKFYIDNRNSSDSVGKFLRYAWDVLNVHAFYDPKADVTHYFPLISLKS